MPFKGISLAVHSLKPTPMTGCGRSISIQLADARRNVDLTGSGETVWCLDYAHNGIGSNSCGPELLEKYRLDAPEFRFALTLVPSASVESTIPHHRNEANA